MSARGARGCRCPGRRWDLPLLGTRRRRTIHRHIATPDFARSPEHTRELISQLPKDTTAVAYIDVEALRKLQRSPMALLPRLAGQPSQFSADRKTRTEPNRPGARPGTGRQLLKVALEGETAWSTDALAVSTLLEISRLAASLSEPKTRAADDHPSDPHFSVAVVRQSRKSHQDRWVRVAVELRLDMLGAAGRSAAANQFH
jgi:hypothetical protein